CAGRDRSAGPGGARSGGHGHTDPGKSGSLCPTIPWRSVLGRVAARVAACSPAASMTDIPWSRFKPIPDCIISDPCDGIHWQQKLCLPDAQKTSRGDLEKTHSPVMLIDQEVLDLADVLAIPIDDLMVANILGRIGPLSTVYEHSRTGPHYRRRAS